MSDGRWAVGVDVGGTFTDLAAVDTEGSVRTTKTLSTPDDRARGVLDAFDASALDAAAVAHVAHGTTVVTNLLLERRGARVALLATRGFTDLLLLRRQERAALYDLTRHHAAPLVDAARTIGVRERTVPEGVLEALGEPAIADAIAALRELSPDTIAIALLHAYAHPAHERRLRDAVAEAFPGIDVVTSHETLPEIREYERTATTVAEAYARPAVRRYLAGLAGRLAERGLPAPRVMTSAGGTLGAGEAAGHAASLALSGPAGGVTGAAAVLRALGITDALTIDIGGTSADVGLIVNGEPLVERGGDVAGVPIALPRVLVEAVAAGGGSVGWLDAGGALRAGPESAGAVPGPAAYGRGGIRPTVTDAHVVLGRIAAGAWSGGVHIDADRARQAIRAIADPLGVSLERAAEALVATADATMARALRRVSVERGIDPRDLALVAFGGGGPLHACGLAERLGISRVVVPPHAGVLSALGLALAPERREGLCSLMTRLDTLDPALLRGTLEREAASLAAGARGLERRWWARARYEGQGHELDVPVSVADTPGAVAERFVALHRSRTGFALERPVECISVRTALEGSPWPVVFRREGSTTGTDLAADRDDGRTLERTVRGDAVVRLPDATLHVRAGWTARAQAEGGWLLETA